MVEHTTHTATLYGHQREKACLQGLPTTKV